MHLIPERMRTSAFNLIHFIACKQTEPAKLAGSALWGRIPGNVRLNPVQSDGMEAIRVLEGYCLPAHVLQ